MANSTSTNGPRRLVPPSREQIMERLLAGARQKEAEAREAAKPKAPVVTLAVSNPDVPLDRQRERIAEATERLIADERRRLAELQAHEARIAAMQRAIDWHMEMKLANEEAERQFRRNDPCGYWR